MDRLRAACTAYLDFAATRPQRYGVMFGGLWTAAEAVDSAAVSAVSRAARHGAADRQRPDRVRRRRRIPGLALHLIRRRGSTTI